MTREALVPFPGSAIALTRERRVVEVGVRPFRYGEIELDAEVDALGFDALQQACERAPYVATPYLPVHIGIGRVDRHIDEREMADLHELPRELRRSNIRRAARRPPDSRTTRGSWQHCAPDR